jgi:hypothetical protein
LGDPAIYRTSPATLLRASRRVLAAKKFCAADKICFTVWSAHGHCKKKTHRRKRLDRESVAHGEHGIRTSVHGIPTSVYGRNANRQGVGGGAPSGPADKTVHFSLALAERIGKVTEDFSPPWWRHGDWRRDPSVRRSE